MTLPPAATLMPVQPAIVQVPRTLPPPVAVPTVIEVTVKPLIGVSVHDTPLARAPPPLAIVTV